MIPSYLFPGRPLLAACVLLASAGVAFARAPLHQRLDQAIGGSPGYAKEAAAVAGDEEFLRRVYLDLTGVIPTAAQARAFLGDKGADRREKLIDRLLASPEFARHMQTTFDVLLMDRRPAKHVPAPQWQEFLRASFAANKPYDQLVRDLLSADGGDPATRPAARFFLDRDGESHLLTRDIGRLFLGMNLQCAQCHDHLLVNQYKQDHYYGIYAFLSRSYVFADKAKKVSVFAEKGEGEVSYQSVFDTKLTKSSGPRMPDGRMVKEPKFDKGQEYVVAPAKDVRPVPKFSRRAQLAGMIAGADNVQFKRTAANRLWAQVMGRGLVYPVDFDHAENPPSHPVLLTTLADEFAGMKFDVRAYLRQLLLSKTYQRSSLLPPGVKELDEKKFAVALLRPLTPEQFAWSLMQATGLTDAERQALGKNATEAALYAKLAGNLAPFVNTFAPLPGQPDDGSFQTTLDQTLFLKNGALIRTWLTPRPGNLVERLSKLKDQHALAEELYLSVLTRLPSADERKDVADFLAGQPGERTAVLGELVWVLVTSAEFRFNH